MGGGQDSNLLAYNEENNPCHESKIGEIWGVYICQLLLFENITKKHCSNVFDKLPFETTLRFNFLVLVALHACKD